MRHWGRERATLILTCFGTLFSSRDNEKCIKMLLSICISKGFPGENREKLETNVFHCFRCNFVLFFRSFFRSINYKTFGTIAENRFVHSYSLYSMRKKC